MLKAGMKEDPIHILVLDDEESLRWVIGKTLNQPDYRVHFAASAEEAVGVMATHPVAFALVDVNLPGASGLSFLERQREVNPDLLVAIITGEGTMDTAISAMKMGAFDYLTKPFDIEEIESLTERAVQAIRRSQQHPHSPDPQRQGEPGPHELIGRGQKIREIHKSIGRVAGSDLTVLILGESGTGKELIARAVHRHSQRHTQPFLAVNCAAIPRELLEAELFGYEKGAFTGAVERKLGKLETAGEGTLFLDEIGDMPLELQAKLLRVLQEREFQRVGGVTILPVRARIIAATNRNLGEEVEQGHFRGDLFYRINAFTIQSSPLRELKEDIPLLIEHFFQAFARRVGQLPPRLTAEAMACLTGYPWPGNVRELENVIKSLVITTPTTLIDVSGLPANLRGNDDSAGPDRQFEKTVLEAWRGVVKHYCDGEKSGLLARVANHLERPLIRQVLMETGWNQVRTAKVLGINRNTLRTKMQHLGISRPR